MALYAIRVALTKRQRISFAVFAVLLWVGLIGYWVPIVKSFRLPPLDLTMIFMMIPAPITLIGLSLVAVSGRLVIYKAQGSKKT